MNDMPPSRGIVIPVGTSSAEIEAAAVAVARKRKLTVYFWRFFILVVILGGWEVLSATKIIDEFFY